MGNYSLHTLASSPLLRPCMRLHWRGLCGPGTKELGSKSCSKDQPSRQYFTLHLSWPLYLRSSQNLLREPPSRCRNYVSNSARWVLPRRPFCDRMGNGSAQLETEKLRDTINPRRRRGRLFPGPACNFIFFPFAGVIPVYTGRGGATEPSGK